MGISAFAGYLFIFLSWPINHWQAKRGIAIQKGLANARDKRMTVLNELIGAVCAFRNVLRAIPFTTVATGQIYKVLRLGRKMDQACFGCQRNGDRMADQKSANRLYYRIPLLTPVSTLR